MVGRGSEAGSISSPPEGGGGELVERHQGEGCHDAPDPGSTYPDPVTESVTLQDIVTSARRTAHAGAALAARGLDLRSLGRHDEEAWTELANAVDELVEVVLFQQSLIEDLLGLPGSELRWSQLVGQARGARAHGGSRA